MRGAKTSLITAVIGALALAGCAGEQASYPSLARRPVERAASAPVPALPPAATAPAAPADPALAGFLSDAHAADSRFESLRAGVEAIAASHPARGSEAWSRAMIALAGLDSARNRTALAMSEIDSRYAAAKLAGDDATALATARGEAIGLLDREDQVLVRLRGALGT